MNGWIFHGFQYLYVPPSNWLCNISDMMITITVILLIKEFTIFPSHFIRSLWWWPACSGSGIFESVFCHVWGGTEWDENRHHSCNTLFSRAGSVIIFCYHSAEKKCVANWGNCKYFNPKEWLYLVQSSVRSMCEQDTVI